MMNFAASIRRLPLLVLVLTVSPSAYGQESLPEIVGRHELKIEELSNEVARLSKELLELRAQMTVDGESTEVLSSWIYLVPLENRSICETRKAILNIGDKTFEFTKIVKTKTSLGMTPYEISIELFCRDAGAVRCNKAGLIDTSSPGSFGGNLERLTNKQYCSIKFTRMQME